MTQPVPTDIQVVFGSVPQSLPVEVWKNRATVFLMDDTDPKNIVFCGSNLSDAMEESLLNPEEVRTYRIAGLQLGPVLYHIPADPGMFVSIRPDANGPAYSTCEFFVDRTEDEVSVQLSNDQSSACKLEQVSLGWICLMSIFISGKLELEVDQADEEKFQAACRTIFEKLQVSPTETPLWVFVTIMALIMDSQNDAIEKDEMLQAVLFACEAYEKYVQNVKVPSPAESDAAPAVILGGTHQGAFQLDTSPAPEGVLLC